MQLYFACGFWSPSHCKEKKRGVLHFIYKAFRALRLLKELEGKCHRERSVTVQTKGGLKMAYSLAYKCSPTESSQVGTSPASSRSVNSLCCCLCCRMGLCRQTMRTRRPGARARLFQRAAKELRLWLPQHRAGT